MEEGELHLKTMDHIYIGDLLLCLLKETKSLICNGKVIQKKESQLKIKHLTNSAMSV